MGTTSSSHSSKGSSSQRAPKGISRFYTIEDKFTTIDQVVDALRREGLESSNLILAVDFTKSNEWTGKHSFGGRCLHQSGATGFPGPYEEVVKIIGRTLMQFDDDQLIPCYGFGDVTTGDKSVFSFFPGDQPAVGMEMAVQRYKDLVPHIKLAGPTSFAAAIYNAIRIVVNNGNTFHILLIIADGQVTRPSDLPDGQLSHQERSTIEAIEAASQFPLSIIMVGVGDGPWDVMQHFDDKLPSRKFDNFQFVNFTEVSQQFNHDPARKEAIFALRALMEMPEQYKLIQQLGMMRASSAPNRYANVRPLEPPVGLFSAPPQAGGPQGQYPSMAQPYPGAPPMAGAQPPMMPGAHTLAEPDQLYVCPITQCIMVDPVLAADGYTYERSAIEQWFQQKDTSPLSNQKLGSKSLVPNHALRSAIMEWQQKR